MKKDDALKLAHSKIEHEHARWNTWVIFFFGSIVSAFTIWGQLEEYIPSEFPCIFGAIISFAWIFVAIGMRRVSKSWVDVISEIEDTPSGDFQPNKLYKKYEGNFSICKDFFNIKCTELSKPKFIECLKLIINPLKTIKFIFFESLRVTKVLTYLGFIFFLLFFFLVYYLPENPTKKPNPKIEIEHFSRLVDSAQICIEEVDAINQRIILIEDKLDKIENKVEKYKKN